MRSSLLTVISLVLAFSGPHSMAQTQSQSKPLGDVARETRTTQKKPSCVYNDENYFKPKLEESQPKPVDKQLDENGNPVKSDTEAAEKQGAAAESAGEKSASGGNQEKDISELRKEWKTKVASQHDKIQMLEREMSVAEREYKLRASSYYADAGLRLRNEKIWLEDEKKYQAFMEEKRQKLDKAKEDLSNMLDQARRAGVNGLD